MKPSRCASSRVDILVTRAASGAPWWLKQSISTVREKLWGRDWQNLNQLCGLGVMSGLVSPHKINKSNVVYRIICVFEPMSYIFTYFRIFKCVSVCTKKCLCEMGLNGRRMNDSLQMLTTVRVPLSLSSKAPLPFVCVGIWGPGRLVSDMQRNHFCLQISVRSTSIAKEDPPQCSHTSAFCQSVQDSV